MFVYFVRWILYRETLLSTACALVCSLAMFVRVKVNGTGEHSRTLTDKREEKTFTSVRQWLTEWNKCPGCLRGFSSFRLSMVELHEAPPSPQGAAIQTTHVLCTFLQVQIKFLCKVFAHHVYFKGSSPAPPANSLASPCHAWAPYSVWINGHCLPVCLCGPLCCNSVSLHHCLHCVNRFKAVLSHVACSEEWIMLCLWGFY